jgi:16S rRNA (guanine527-N7)-methyltransferase
VPFRERLAKRCRKAGLTLPPDVILGLEAYFELLAKWNRKVSLTSLPVSEGSNAAIDRLLVEPVLAARYLPDRSSAVIDIGSGGGSPAVPMKVSSPGISMRMVESKNRKAAFLREAVWQLALEQTTVEAARFEDLLTRPEMRESADVVTVRAVRIERQTLMELRRFLKPEGLLFLFRTGSLGVEKRGTRYSLLPHLDSWLAVVPRNEI